ncbi:MAG: TonB-dependent receptor plug domain-containing protein, partial [Verrucomicrobiae bacterium]|nr:TonB-dependent receptor plug domain-containing protein [Verrucomicrobiae bacterium]
MMRLLRKPFLVFVLITVAGLSRLTAQTSSDSMELVDLEAYEIQSEYRFDDLKIDTSSSQLNENLLGIYGSTQLQDLSGLAPNLSFINSDTRGFGDILSMRGSANSLFFSAPSVGLYVDGVPGGSVSTYPGELDNIASVVIRSGSQSTLYGRNASAGIIDIRTRRPGDATRAALQLEYGDYDTQVAKALVDGPISDTVAYSASVGYKAHEGYIDNIAAGDTEDDRESIHAKLNFYLNPSDDTEMRFGVFAEEVDDGATRLSSLLSPDPYQVSSNVRGVTQLDRLQLNFQFRKQLDAGELTATSSYQDWDLNPSLTELDLSPYDFGFSRVLQDEAVFSQEFKFVSSPDNSSTRYTVGLFYFDSSTDGDATREFPVPPSDFVPPGFVQNERTLFEIDNQNIALFANATTAVSDKVSLNYGIRADQNRSSIHRTKTASNNFGYPSPQDPVVDESQSETEGSATIGLTFDAGEGLEFILRSSLSQKPEGYSGYTANPNFIQFDSEHMISYEAGINYMTPDEAIETSVVVFVNDTDNYQFERTVPYSTDFAVENAENVSAEGIEGKMVINPAGGLFFDFQAGLVDARFDKHLDAFGNDVSGKHVPFIPKYTLRMGVRCEWQ